MADRDISTNINVRADSGQVDDLAAAVDKAKAAVDKLTDATIEPDADTSGVDDLAEAVDAAQVATDDLSDTSAAPGSDSSEIDDLTSSAGDAQSALDDVSDTVVAPTGDSSGLEDIVGSAGDAGDSIGEVGDEAGGAGDAIAGMAGKAAAHLPGVGKILGPLSRSFSSLVKDAASGGSSMAKIGATGGALALVAFTMKGLADDAEQLAKTKAWEHDQIDAYSKSIKEGGDQVKALVDRLTEAGQIQLNALNSQIDITPALAAAGVSVDQFARVSLAGKAAIDEFGHALEDAGVKSSDVAVIVGAARNQSDAYAQAVKTAAATASVFKDDQVDLGRETEHVGTAAQDAGIAIQNQSAAMEAAAQAAGHAQRETDNLKASWDVLTGALADKKSLLDLTDSFSDLHAKALIAIDAEKNHAADADQKQRDYQQSLIATQQMVLDYAKEVGGLPPEVVSKIVADVDNGSIASADALLNRIAHDRHVIYNAQVSGHREFDQGPALGPGKAAGGSVAPFSIQPVNELGPEGLTVGGRDYLMMGSKGGKVTPNNKLGGGPSYIHYGDVNVYEGDAASFAQTVMLKMAGL